MKRTVAALVILLLIFSVWFFERRIIDTTCVELNEAVVFMVDATANQKGIDDKISEFLKKWEKAEKRFDSLMTHEDADEINLLIIRFIRSVEVGDLNSARTVAEEIKWHIKDISEKSKVDLTTVL